MGSGRSGTAAWISYSPEPCFVLEGAIAGSAIRARLKKSTADSFYLRQRGFNWVNEYPINR